MAVREGKIVCVGGIEQIMLECGGDNDERRNHPARGKFVMPGFNDAHVHLGGAAADMLAVRLNGVASVEELQKRVADAVAAHKEGDWITGSGWDHTLWPDKKFPTKQQLDAVAPKNPVLLTHISGHVAVANSLALQLARSRRTRPTPRAANSNATPTGKPPECSKKTPPSVWLLQDSRSQI